VQEEAGAEKKGASSKTQVNSIKDILHLFLMFCRMVCLSFGLLATVLR
jgi:hypothetical protein